MWDELTRNVFQSFESIGRLIGEWLNQHLINIVAILVGAWLFRRFGANVINRALKRTIRPDLYPTKVDREKRLRTLDSIVVTAMRIVVYTIVAILIVGEINPSYTTALFASAGFIGVALGFGAQSLIKDFVSGVFIITENQYRVGDVVKLGEISGVVEDVTIRTTVLRDLDGKLHHIPNGSVQVTTNMTLEFSSINEDIVVGYGTDVHQLEHVINHTGDEMAADPSLESKILVPPHFERIDAFGESGMVVKILGKTTPGDQWRVKGELYRRLKKAFDKNHIEIPYRHVVVHNAQEPK